MSYIEIAILIGFVIAAGFIIFRNSKVGISTPAVPPVEYPRPFPGSNKDETKP